MPLTPRGIQGEIPDLDRVDHADGRGPCRARQSRGQLRVPSAAGLFSPPLLASARVVLVDTLPMPPLSQMGLTQFTEWERIIRRHTYLTPSL